MSKIEKYTDSELFRESSNTGLIIVDLKKKLKRILSGRERCETRVKLERKTKYLQMLVNEVRRRTDRILYGNN